MPGCIVLAPQYRHAEAVRGLDQFDYLWIIWEFHAAAVPHTDGGSGVKLTVRPPRLGGNERIGVFASRSPFRPNRLGLSSVRIDRIEMTPGKGPVIHVLGADLMDGTPIYDVKPYVAYADAHPQARSGFVDEHEWHPLEVVIPADVARHFTIAEQEALRELLSQDPRPRYHADAERVYGMPFSGHDVRFRIGDGVVTVVGA